MASYLHRTATTTYPCCLPALGDSAGAGRIRLATSKIKKKNESISIKSGAAKKPQLNCFLLS
jgi:hypothetical protein